MRRFLSFFIVSCLLAGTPLISLAEAAEGDLLGTWVTHKGGHINFVQCGNNICGYVSKLARKGHATPPTDIQNPDKTLRMVPLLGLQIFSRFQYEGEDFWDHGRIYNVENGKTYRSKLRLISSTELKLSGCVFIFCRSYRWNKAPEQKAPEQKAPEQKAPEQKE